MQARNLTTDEHFEEFRGGVAAAHTRLFFRVEGLEDRWILALGELDGVSLLCTTPTLCDALLTGVTACTSEATMAMFGVVLYFRPLCCIIGSMRSARRKVDTLNQLVSQLIRTAGECRTYTFTVTVDSLPSISLNSSVEMPAFSRRESIRFSVFAR